jgi:hypothetical protein
LPNSFAPETSTSGSFVEIVIAYPIDSPDNFGVNMPMNVANDPLVPQPGLLDNMNEINGLTEGITPECFCYAIDFMK